jgi:hypothetical protein
MQQLVEAIAVAAYLSDGKGADIAVERSLAVA